MVANLFAMMVGLFLVLSTRTTRGALIRNGLRRHRRPPRAAATTRTRMISSSSAAISGIPEQIRQEATREMQRVVDFYQGSNDLDSVNIPELLSTREQVSQFLNDNKIETVLFDCDGALYRSPDSIPGAAESIRTLLRENKQVFFITNNAASNRKQLRDKLTDILRLDDDHDNNLLTPEMMVSSSYACATYLRQELVEKKKGSSSSSSRAKVFVIGSEGLCEELRQAGLDVCSLHQQGAHDDGETAYSMSRDELAAYDFSQLHPINAVVVGHDTEYNFRKLCIANVLLQWNPEALLVATNMDNFDLVGADGRHIPGNGSLVRSVCDGWIILHNRVAILN